jgi:hypothetical protein
MEWMNRGGQPAPASQPHATPTQTTTKRGRPAGPMQWATVLLLFALTLLLLAIAASFAFGKKDLGDSQSKFVDKSKMQAVFLNGGQVYFGKIKDLNDKSLRMGEIYYLRVNQTVQPNTNQAQNSNDISLVKLGCELHGPQDEMVINQSQVIFWENLKADGQVAQAVQKYKDQNPNGQQCNTNQSSGGNSTTPTTGTGTGAGTGTNNRNP